MVDKQSIIFVDMEIKQNMNNYATWKKIMLRKLN